MIVYYIHYLRTKAVTWGRREHAKRFVGTVTFYDHSRSRAMKLGGSVRERPLMIFKGTAFDDSTQPPTLVRCDYGFEKLRQCGAELPPLFIDTFGNIRRSEDDEIVLPGPDTMVAGDVITLKHVDGKWVQL